MKKIITILSLFFLVQLSIAQKNTKEEGVYLAEVGHKILELEMDGFFSLWFTDADTGKPIKGASVTIEKNDSIETNADGLAIFPALEDGKYTFLFEKKGYVTTKDKFEVLLGSIFFNKYSIPLIKKIDHIKIILDWSATPPDLDAHLVKENEYHISYRNMITSADKTAWLDRDALTGYGPETITVTQVDKITVYRYFVHNYTNRNAVNDSRLSQSKATVRVYINNRFHASYQIKAGNIGTTWNVFNIVNGEIKLINNLE